MVTLKRYIIIKLKYATISEQISEGNRNILGAMIESNIKSGNQKLIDKIN